MEQKGDFRERKTSLPLTSRQTELNESREKNSFQFIQLKENKINIIATQLGPIYRCGIYSIKQTTNQRTKRRTKEKNGNVFNGK